MRPALALIALVAGGLAGPRAAGAQEPKIKVTVVAILATDRTKSVDPELECLAREVRKQEPRLTGFRLVRCTCKSLALGTSEPFPLVDREVASVTVEHGADKDNRVSLRVKPPLVGEIDYTCACGKFFPIMTRYLTKDKERLIIAIMVRPCNKR
jgi:hypothetical protein